MVINMKSAILTDDALSVLCTELSETISSGITVGEGFLLISEQEEDERLRGVYRDIYEFAVAGGSLSEAMRRAGVFPEYMLRLVTVAEATGALDNTMRGLADYYDRRAAMKRSIRSAVGYPLLLFIIVLAVFFLFLTEVLPVFSNVFEQIGATMSPLATAFLRAGLWLGGAKWWFVGVLAAIALFALCCRLVPSLGERVGRWLAGAFSGTKTGRRLTDARLASVLALALSGASDINEALDMSCEFAKGADGEERINACRKAVMEGDSLASAAARLGLFSPVYCRMLGVAERSGSMEGIMRDIARRTQREADLALAALTGRVEPITVAVLTVLVGLLLLSVMLPLIGIMSAL